jgi:predicted nuclease of predicted toxin-antitoxin system
MNLKLDENPPEALAPALIALGHNVDNVRVEGFAGRNDGKIWEAAQDSGRFLITQDLDFSDIRKFAPGTHCGLMLVRLQNPGRIALEERIAEAFAVQDAESWARCFVLLTDHKLRVRRSAT